MDDVIMYLGKNWTVPELKSQHRYGAEHCPWKGGVKALKDTQMGVICGKRQAKFCAEGGPFEVFPGVLHLSFWRK